MFLLFFFFLICSIVFRFCFLFCLSYLHFVDKFKNSKKDSLRWKDVDLAVVPCWWDGGSGRY
jgi:hypothetical protein